VDVLPDAAAVVSAVLLGALARLAVDLVRLEQLDYRAHALLARKAEVHVEVLVVRHRRALESPAHVGDAV